MGPLVLQLVAEVMDSEEGDEVGHQATSPA
jgi:hypothetical protein